MRRWQPDTRDALIFVDHKAHLNLYVVQSTIRHLRSGGSVLIFPRGRMEPDPAVLPGALESMPA
jgi:putative hemolysin